VVAAHPDQDGQVRPAVLDRAEGRPDDRPGRVVDGADEGQPRPAALEPVVRTAVDLDQQPGLGHPLAAAPVPRRAALPGGPQAGPAEQALERRAADDDALGLGQQLGQVAVVDAPIAAPREVHDARPVGRREAPRRGPAAVAVDDALDAHRPVPCAQPPGRPLARVEKRHGRIDRERSLAPADQDIVPLLVSWVQGQSLPHR